MREYHEIKHDTYFFALPMECSLHALPNEFITSGKGGEGIDTYGRWMGKVSWEMARL